MSAAALWGQAAAAPATKKAAAPAKAAKPQSVKDLRFPKMKELKLPDITEFTLPNGMRVFLLENHELPLVRGYAMVRAGNIFDPADKVGLSDVFGDVMRSGGTKARTGDELNEMLEGIAASVESNIGETSGTLSFNTLKEHTGKVLDVFKEVLVSPEFREDKLDVALTQYRSAILRRNDQASGIAPREFSRIVYGPDTPWGRQMEIEHVDRIKREDLFAYHKRYFFPANILLAVQGDFNTAEMRAQLEKLFADWTVQQPPVPALPPVNTKAKPGVYLAEKQDVNQSSFRVGHLGGQLKDKDYPALEVMADILGGGFTSRLVQKVRSDMGLAYSVSASWSPNYNHPGTFTIGGGTKSESTVDALRAIMGEVERIRTNEVTDEELRIAKESTLNSFVFNFATPSQVLSRLVGYEYHGYPRDFIFSYQKAIAAVTKADVLRVAKQYVKPEEFVVVAVGKPSEMKTPLSALNLPMHKVDLTIPQPKAAAAKADAGSLAKGKQMLAALQAAVGGADKLAAVKDYQHTAEVTVAAMQGVKIKQISSVLGDAIRFEQQLPFGKILVYSDGKGGGWMSGPQGQAPLPPQFAKQTDGELFRLQPRLWLSDRNPDRTVNAVGDREVEISDKTGNQIRLTLGADNLPVKAAYRSPDGQQVEATYTNWKEAGAGLKLPHQFEITQGGKKAAEIAIQEYKLNSGLTEEGLAAKP
jgi:zinc protease